MALTASAATGTPSPNLVGELGAELARHAPFAQMAPEHVAQFVLAATQVYHAPGELVWGPQGGTARTLWLLRQGSVTGASGAEGGSSEPFEFSAGDMFPVGAVLAGRAVTSTYTAHVDCFSLALPAEEVQRLAAASPPFASFLQRRTAHYLELSRRAVQTAWASQTLAAQALEARLATLPRKQPLACGPATPLAEALAQMHERRVGSVMVVDEAMAPLGILTRHDILGRVTLPQLPLQTPLAQVMSAPVRCLDAEHTLLDAALLMTRHGVRHVPVTEGGRLVNIVSERDLFALQRLSLKQLSTQIRAAADEATLRVLAAQIRQFALHLLGQGVQARQLTELVSHLNDVLTERLVQLVAARRGLDLARACWLAFGSEGRGEQTVSTDQDNGLVFDSTAPDADRPRWMAFGQEVNEALDAAGYPLCKGGIMAGHAECCLSVAEWQQRFAHWMRHSEPEDLLKASIFFDLRPLCGRTALAEELAAMPAREAAQLPRFMRLMVENALRRGAPLNWRGALATQDEGGHEWLDLKLQGTAIFVDAARLFALAQGLPALGTRARLETAAPGLRVAPPEAEAWVGAFEFLQMLRLRVQLGPRAPGAGGAGGADAAQGAQGDAANRVDVKTLNDIDRRVLKEAVRVARRLQQRLEMDFLH